MAQESPPPAPKLGPPIDIFEVALFGPGRYRLWLIPCAVIGLAIGFWMALIRPNSFNSSARVFITWGEREQFNGEKMLKGIGGPMGGGGAKKKGGGGGWGMSKELQFMKNSSFYERIAREVGSERMFETFDPLRYDTPNTPKYIHWQHLAQDWWFNGGKERTPENKAPRLDLDTQIGVSAARQILDQRLRMRPKGMNVLQISANAGSPELAQDIVQAAVKVAKQRHFEIFDERFNAEFVSTLRDEAIEKNELASEEYYKHQQDCGFHNINLQRNQLMNQRMILENDLEKKDLRMEEILREKEYLRDQLAITPEETEIFKEPWNAKNPIFNALEAKLDDYAKEIGKLDLIYLEGAPLYVKQKEFIEEQILRVEQQLEVTEPYVERGRNWSHVGPNPEFNSLSRALEALDRERDRILIGQGRAQNRLEAISDTLAAIMACEPKHQEMNAVIAATKGKANQYKKALGKRESVKILDNEESMGNIWVIQQPSYSQGKVGPQRSKTVLQGLGIGFGVGIGLAILRQLLDQRLRYPFAVQRILGAPVLGVVPEERTWKRLTQKMRKQEAAAQA